jgi:uncharacterized phiE125 gp8 family phage protein
VAVRVLTPPAALPLTLDEVKAHLHVDHTDDDAMIEIYNAAATAHAEVFCGRALMPRTLELVLDKFKTQIEIPLPPLIKVNAVFYDDAAGDEQQLAENLDYVVDTVSQPGWIVAANSTWPTTLDAINAVRIRFDAGYLNDAMSPPTPNVPDDIKAAILLIIGNMYANREDVITGTIAAKLPFGAEALLRQHRVELALA